MHGRLTWYQRGGSVMDNWLQLMNCPCSFLLHGTRMCTIGHVRLHSSVSYLVLVQVETSQKYVNFVDAANRHQRRTCPLTYTDIISPTSGGDDSSIVGNSNEMDKWNNRRKSSRGFLKWCLPIWKLSRNRERRGIISKLPPCLVYLISACSGFSMRMFEILMSILLARRKFPEIDTIWVTVSHDTKC